MNHPNPNLALQSGTVVRLLRPMEEYIDDGTEHELPAQTKVFTDKCMIRNIEPGSVPSQEAPARPRIEIDYSLRFYTGAARTGVVEAIRHDGEKEIILHHHALSRSKTFKNWDPVNFWKEGQVAYLVEPIKLIEYGPPACPVILKPEQPVVIKSTAYDAQKYPPSTEMPGNVDAAVYIVRPAIEVSHPVSWTSVGRHGFSSDDDFEVEVDRTLLLSSANSLPALNP